MKSLYLFIVTISYLKFSQFFFRIFYILPPLYIKRKYKSNFVKSDAWKTHLNHRNGQISKKVFTFLNKEKTLNKDLSWNSGSEKLWLFNLHYFDYLNSKGSEKLIDDNINLILEWINSNPAYKGIGWNQYTISLRVINWIKFFSRNESVSEIFVDSITEQIKFLYERPEYHIQANHLFTNSKSLLFYGAFFNGRFSRKVLKKGLKIFYKEIEEQLLDDGGHFECSPMYHSIIMYDLLDIYNLSKSFPKKFPKNFSDIVEKKFRKMIHWYCAVLHPDKKIPFFNDSAFDIAPSYDEIFEYIKILDLDDFEVKSSNYLTLNESGYTRIKNEDFFLIYDHGEVQPSYQPGHSHADLFSFELSYKENRFLVNRGISTYEDTLRRLYERSSRSHNTVEVDGMSNCGVWRSFRVSYRPNLIDHFSTFSNNSFSISSQHDAFSTFNSNLIHKREIDLHDSKLRVKDTIEGKFLKAYSYFHFHPDVKIIKKDQKKILFSLNKEIISLTVFGDYRLIYSKYNLGFNNSLKNISLRCSLKKGENELTFSFNE
jgi:uncharacterized heparinase superfamily protein